MYTFRPFSRNLGEGPEALCGFGARSRRAPRTGDSLSGKSWPVGGDPVRCGAVSFKVVEGEWRGVVGSRAPGVTKPRIGTTIYTL